MADKHPLPGQTKDFRKELEPFIHKNDYDAMVKYAEQLAKGMQSAKLSSSQLRNIFGMVKQIQTEEFNEANVLKLKMLRPKLAYAAAKKEDQLKGLADVLDAAIQLVGSYPKAFQRFADFFEAIVAYYYASGKK